MTACKSLPDTFDGWVEELLAKWGVPGVALGIVRLNAGNDAKSTVKFRNYGTAGRGRSVTEQTLFGIASNTKVMTAAAMGQLIEKGIVPSWRSKLRDIEPDFKLQDEFSNARITLVDALSHQSGLPRHENSYYVGQNTEELVKRMRGLKPSAELRTEWQYNNQMYILAAHIVAQKTGMSFTSYVETSLFKPLGMTSSTFSPMLDGQQSRDKLSGSFVRTGDGRVFEIPYGFDRSKEDLQFCAGAGGAVSCTSDMVKWVQALIVQRRRAEKEDLEAHQLDSVLSTSTVKSLTDGYAVVERHGAYPESSPFVYGLGLRTKHYQGHELISHGGDVPGFGSQVMWSPQGGIGVVVLTSMAGEGNYLADSLCYRVFEELLPGSSHGLERIDWTARFQSKYHQGREDLATAVDQARARILKPADQASRMNLHNYAGTYHDPSQGYPDIVVQVVTAAEERARRNKVVYDSPGPLLPEGEQDHLWLNWPGWFGAKGIDLYPVKVKASEEQDQEQGEEWTGLFVNAFDDAVQFSARKSAGGDQVRLEQYWSRPVRVRFDRTAGGSVKRIRIWGVWGAGSEQSKKEERGDWGEEQVAFDRREH